MDEEGTERGGRGALRSCLLLLLGAGFLGLVMRLGADVHPQIPVRMVEQPVETGGAVHPAGEEDGAHGFGDDAAGKLVIAAIRDEVAS